MIIQTHYIQQKIIEIIVNNLLFNIYNYIKMQPNQKLVSILEKITKRHYSITFSKILLFQEDKESDDGPIRHYDIQCEAVESMVDTLNTKAKAIKFKCFYLIKHYKKESNATRKRVKTQNSSFLNNNSLNSYYGRINQDRSMKEVFRVPKTSRNGDITQRRNFDKTNSILSQIDWQMSALVDKMKFLNKKIQKKQDDDPQNLQISRKITKRNLIINKLNELGNDLSQLISEDVNVSLISHSNIIFKYQPITQRNSKTTRQFNRTFCTSRNDLM